MPPKAKKSRASARLQVRNREGEAEIEEQREQSPARQSPVRRQSTGRRLSSQQPAVQHDPRPASLAGAGSSTGGMGPEDGSVQEFVYAEGEEMADDDPLPIMSGPQSSSASVSDHLDDVIRRKIVQGRYVSLCSLLPTHRSSEKLTFDARDRTLTAQSGSRKLYNYREWVDAFYVYAAVRCEVHKDEGSLLFKYMQTIKRIHDRGGNFVQYDEAFRARHRGKAFIDWGTLEDGQLSWALNDPGYVPYDKFMAEKARSSKQQSGRPTGGPKVCYGYNQRSGCTKAVCHFPHKCQRCQGSHPVMQCKGAEGRRY